MTQGKVTFVEAAKEPYAAATWQVLFQGRLVGTVSKYFPTRERKAQGLRYVSNRWTSRVPAWRYDCRQGEGRDFRTRKAAVEAMLVKAGWVGR